MTVEEIVELVRCYPEFEHDLDETACPNGWMTCVICGGGGATDGRTKRPIRHKPGCLRERFEREHGGAR